MAKVMKRVVEVFPPNDRELALRAQIKTGWSTISGRKTQRAGITSSELKQIQQVLEKAQAMEHMEEIRIGLQILKHKQMIQMCRGDGITTCRICNRDFTQQRTSKPEPIQYCSDCQKVVCIRCKTPYKCLNGESINLCNICYEERELWKRSGSWLNNSLPSISIPAEELEEILQQQQQNNSRKPNIGRQSLPKQDSHGFVNPYQLEAEESDDDDDDSVLSGSQSRLNFTSSPDSRKLDTSSPSFLTGTSQARASPIPFESNTLPKMSSSAKGYEDHRSRMQTDSESSKLPISRKTGFSRRKAMAGNDRERLQHSRNRARSRSASREASATPNISPHSSPIHKQEPKVESSNQHPKNGAVPAIKIRKPSVMTSPKSSRKTTPSPEDYESDQSDKAYVIRQVRKPSTDSEIMYVGAGLIQETVLGEEGPENGSPSHNNLLGSPEHAAQKQKPSPHPRGIQQSEELDDFKKVQSSPSPKDGFRKVIDQPRPTTLDEFKKVGSNPPTKSPPQLEKDLKKVGTSPVKSPLQLDDEFRKVGASPTKSPPQFEDEFKKVGTSPVKSPPQLEDGFKKVGPSPTKPPPQLQDEFKKVRTSPTKSAPRVEDELGTSPTKPAPQVEDEFKKVGASPTKPPPQFQDEFKKVRTSPTKPAPRVEDEFKKVGTTSNFNEMVSPRPKPVPAKRRGFPVPAQEKQTPPEASELKFHPDKSMLGEIGKQGSATSAASSVMSEHSTTFDDSFVTGGVTSSTSFDSLDSVETHNKSEDKESTTPEVPPVTLDHHPRQISRKNATRVSRHSKRPPPHPSTTKEEEGKAEDDLGERFRTRSGVVKRTGRVQRGPRSGSGGDDNPLSTVSEGKSTTITEEKEEILPSQRLRSRVSSSTARDRALARVARMKEGSNNDSTPARQANLKADGSFGSIKLTLLFNESSSELKVTIHGCNGLRAMDSNGFSDPYVKLYLRPSNKSQRFQTRVILKNLEPVFNEQFTFTGITRESIQKKSLCAVVMDYDEFSKDDLIGGTQIKLYEVLSPHTSEVCVKRLLDDRSVPKCDFSADERGTVHLSIHFSSEQEGLVVTVLNARNLSGNTSKGSYVKCHWMNKSNSLKARTKISTRTNNPEFNEALIFPASLRDLTYSTLVIRVWDHHPLKDKLLGEVQLTSFTFWKSFINDPTKVVKEWYPLEAPSAPARSYTGTLPRTTTPTMQRNNL